MHSYIGGAVFGSIGALLAYLLGFSVPLIAICYLMGIIAYYADLTASLLIFLFLFLLFSFPIYVPMIGSSLVLVALTAPYKASGK
ncbi:hypothetical protein SECTIM467_99 [Brevibacillus phage SecTim467]|uniref:Uncharacterized protein n=2 Tax=Jenstvirus jenst TaxID=1982225 RepID=A0A0K2CPA6_9CAUD|nr:hypothetical protein AVV11_gp097 [Brevibacillus phage Jenst]ALA07223.1 hypothetical protein JENST_94 [Brevibacillus phage Jenst]ALA07440.1 hypothetical protein SECTIM467_99 [Brevibacillus phage SecTim467]